jgi:hypothetical protein
MSKKKTLKTTLKREFFDAIYRGEKVEEYRDLSEYWMSRLLVKEPDGSYTFEKYREYDTVLFRNGYNPDSPVMEVEWKETYILEYLDEPKNAFERFGFVIVLGEVLGVENYGG